MCQVKECSHLFFRTTQFLTSFASCVSQPKPSTLYYYPVWRRAFENLRRRGTKHNTQTSHISRTCIERKSCGGVCRYAFMTYYFPFDHYACGVHGIYKETHICQTHAMQTLTYWKCPFLALSLACHIKYEKPYQTLFILV